MNPSTSLGTRSNVGMAKPSPLVRQAGNIGRLLVIHGVCRRSVPSACPQVKYRCRCRVTSLASTITAWPFVGLAQTASKVYRIGILSTNPLPAETSVGAAILRAVAKHGYIPGRNVALEMRAGGEHSDQLPQLAKELVASKVDVIMTFSFPAAAAAKNATTTIPIVTTEA